MKKKALKILAVVLIAASVGYIGFQLVAITRRTYTTQTALLFDMTDSTECEGLFYAQRVALPYSGGVLGYWVGDGERVSAETGVAAVYGTADSAQSYVYAQSLQNQQELLAKAQDATAAATDVQLLTKQINTCIIQIENTAASGNLELLAQQKQELEYYYNKLQLGTQQPCQISQTVALADTSVASAQAAGSPISVIAASQRGCFLSAEGNGSQPYTAEQLDAMQPAELRQAAADLQQTTEAGVAGYILTDYKWRYYTTVDLKRVEKLSEGDIIHISFNGSYDTSVPITVQEIKPDEENKIAKLTLESDYFNENVTGDFTKNATLYFNNKDGVAYYQGLRIDKKALRIVDGQYGVYIRYGGMAYFKPIIILFEDENYILTPLQYEEGKNELRMYDAVIVSGKDLSDEKIL